MTKFEKTLRPHERVSFDPEDVLLELWSKIAEKDHKWEPERGRYISFVGSIVETELHRIRDRSKTVRSPGNSAARLREYEARAAEGTITPGQVKTAGDIRRVNSGQPHLGVRGDGEAEQAIISLADRTPSVEAAVRRAEEVAHARHLIAQGVSALSPYESKLLGEAFGLWGQPARKLGAVARSRRRSVGTIRKQIEAALAKCNAALARVA